ncbi:YchJ family protein [Aggregatibacter actinomycetemcomitans]|nr:YchJ family protein [Aggregatibacter actinomycetemcomitans]
MTALLDSHCPCQSRKIYGECCGRFHSYAQFPETAEQLMRSRYAAYVLKNVPYIVETTVPSQQKLLNVQAIQTWAENTQWLGLQILNTETLTKVQSAVEFNAVFQGEDGEQAHHERSIFVKIDGRWYFVDPTVPLPTMKQPCVCGSGKKFKHCCGGLL